VTLVRRARRQALAVPLKAGRDGVDGVSPRPKGKPKAATRLDLVVYCDHDGYVTAAHVPCPLCKTPCSSRATICDVCEQPLDQAPDLAALEEERRELRSKIGLAVVASLALVAGSFLFFGGLGFFVLAPGAWLGTALVRYREVSKLLRANQPTSF